MKYRSATSVPVNMGQVAPGLESMIGFDGDLDPRDHCDWLVGVSAKTMGTIKCEYGHKSNLTSQGSPYGSGSCKDTLFDQKKTGWSLIQTNGSEHYGNILLSFKDKNRWLQARHYWGFGGKFKQHNDNTHSMWVTDVATAWKHKTKDEYRYSSIAIVSGAGDGGFGGNKGQREFYLAATNQLHHKEIRRWGSDWLFFGVVIRIKNNGGKGSHQSEISCKSFRINTMVDEYEINPGHPEDRPYEQVRHIRMIVPAPRSDADRANFGMFTDGEASHEPG